MFIPPLLLEQVDKPLSGRRWICEPKIDGHRFPFSRSKRVTKAH